MLARNGDAYPTLPIVALQRAKLTVKVVTATFTTLNSIKRDGLYTSITAGLHLTLLLNLVQIEQAAAATGPGAMLS